MDIKYLIGLVVAALSYGYYQKQKRNSAEALNTSIQTREELQKTQAKVDKNNASLDVEEAKRAELKEQGNEKSSLSIPDLIDFFTKR